MKIINKNCFPLNSWVKTQIFLWSIFYHNPKNINMLFSYNFYEHFSFNSPIHKKIVRIDNFYTLFLHQGLISNRRVPLFHPTYRIYTTTPTKMSSKRRTRTKRPHHWRSFVRWSIKFANYWNIISSLTNRYSLVGFNF